MRSVSGLASWFPVSTSFGTRGLPKVTGQLGDVYDAPCIRSVPDGDLHDTRAQSLHRFGQIGLAAPRRDRQRGAHPVPNWWRERGVGPMRGSDPSDWPRALIHRKRTLSYLPTSVKWHLEQEPPACDQVAVCEDHQPPFILCSCALLQHSGPPGRRDRWMPGNQLLKEHDMSKRGGSPRGGGKPSGGRSGGGRRSGSPPNAPSKTGNPSGGGRGNNPPRSR